MTDRELMKWALYALEGSNAYDWPVVEKLKERLAQPEQEPVAWLFQHEETGLTECVDTQQVDWGFEKNNPRWQKIAPLYTAPPQRQWQGLTDEEIIDVLHPLVMADLSDEATDYEIARAIESKLREKNT